MLWAILLLIPVALVISLPLTAAMRALGHRLRALDGAGVAGQVKFAARKVPNTGGVAVFTAVALPVIAGLTLIWMGVDGGTCAPLAEHLGGIHARTGEAAALIGALCVLHGMGLRDDRKPLPAKPKLLVMLALAAVVSVMTGSRLLTLLDPYVGGPWLSYVLTVLWMVVITNAFNFLDNMDGLSGGVAAIAASFFLVATLVNPTPQWFVAACLALLIGSLSGFLFFNFPWRGPATIFMGDGGSLVVGFLLAFLTVRTTYVPEGIAAGGWYAAFMPVVVLAIPLYDFTSVTIIRLSQGKSPFVGDLQHFSHRLVQRGLSRRAAVIVILGFTAVTAIGGISLASLKPWQAVLVGVQTMLVLMVLGMWEWSAVRQSRRATGTVEGAK